MSSYKEILKNIDTLFFDVDGVFTNNIVLLSETGELQRSMSTKDGYAVKRAVESGMRVVIISGGKSEAVKKRFEGLGVSDVFIGIEDKLTLFNEYCVKHNVNLNNSMFMGDDIPDYLVMQKVALAVAPQDACSEIKEIATYISPKNGGEGCVREILEQILREKGTWFNPNTPST